MRPSADFAPVGIGFYSVAEAARLLRVPARNVNRWLGGYTYTSNGERAESPPLWSPELARAKNHIELSFRDLIELRFVKAFTDAGLGLKTIRNCLTRARKRVGDDRPFSTRRFQTDGRTIFLESLSDNGHTETIDLATLQLVFRNAMEASFKDLDIEADAIARWRPFHGKGSIVIDPRRAFGQPIAAAYGVTTAALADAALVESSLDRVARLYDVPVELVRDAVDFEAFLMAA